MDEVTGIRKVWIESILEHLSFLAKPTAVSSLFEFKSLSHCCEWSLLFRRSKLKMEDIKEVNKALKVRSCLCQRENRPCCRPAHTARLGVLPAVGKRVLAVVLVTYRQNAADK